MSTVFGIEKIKLYGFTNFHEIYRVIHHALSIIPTKYQIKSWILSSKSGRAHHNDYVLTLTCAYVCVPSCLQLYFYQHSQLPFLFNRYDSPWLGRGAWPSALQDGSSGVLLRLQGHQRRGQADRGQQLSGEEAQEEAGLHLRPSSRGNVCFGVHVSLQAQALFRRDTFYNTRFFFTLDLWDCSLTLTMALCDANARLWS